MKTFIVKHHYESGFVPHTDTYLVSSETMPSIEDVVEVHSIDFEPDNGEEVSINEAVCLHIGDKAPEAVGGFNLDDYATIAETECGYTLSREQVVAAMKYSQDKLFDASIGLDWGILEQHLEMWMEATNGEL